MGYDIHITRQGNWFDENDSQKIALDEWKDFLNKDPEMHVYSSVETATTSGKTLLIENEGLAVWTKYSGDGLNGNHAWFDYRNGNIAVKNPDNEIISKMLDIAVRLSAKVQGDEGEIYERSTNKEIVYKKTVDNHNKSNKQKHWWKFWKIG